MVDPKIRISADVSAVEAALKKVNDAARQVNQTLLDAGPGAAQAGMEELGSSASELVDSLDDVKESGEAVSKIDFGAVAKALANAEKVAAALEKALKSIGKTTAIPAAVKDAKALSDGLERAAKAQRLLAQDGVHLSRQQSEEAKRQFDRWRTSGARGTSRLRGQEFDDWLSGGWRNYSMNESEARRQRARVLQSIGVNMPGGGGGSGGSGAGGGMSAGRGRWGAIAGAVGGAMGSMLQGGDGGMLSAAGGGLGSLIGAGAGAVFGGPVGAAVGLFAGKLLGGAGSALDAAVGRVVEQNSGLTDLRHSLGATVTDFDTLRESLMYFTDKLGVTGQESVRLAQAFSSAAGKTIAAADLSKSVGGSVAFARGYGLDPALATQFFGSMRHFGVSNNAEGDKRLALLIGEAIGKSGMNAKMGDFMTALQSYVETQSRTSLTQANTSAYASFMSSMTGLNLTGLKGDPQTAMSAMGAADAALRQGGAFGEASKMFTLGMYQRMLPGFNVFGMGFLNDQGAFGTVGRAFGDESPAMAMARAMGDRRTQAQLKRWAGAGGSGQSMLALQMRSLESRYGSGGALVLNQAIQGHLGVNADQAAALYTAYKSDKGLGGLSKTLGAAGIDIGKVDAGRVAALAQVAGMDRAGIRGEASRLLNSGQLNEGERGKLNAALQAGKDDDLKKMVLNLTALHDTTRDSGQAMREQQANMARYLEQIVTVGIPYIQMIKEGITALAQKIAPDSNFAKNAAREENLIKAKIADTSLQKDFDNIQAMPDGAAKSAEINRYNYNLGLRQKMPDAAPSSLQMLDKNGNTFTIRDGGSSKGALFNDYEWFKSKGVPDHIAKAVAAGIYAEGGGLGYARNGAFGIGQLRGDRLQRAFARYGKDPTRDKLTRDEQREYILWELQGGDPGGASVMSSRNEEEAVSNYVGQTNPDGKTGWGFMRPAAGRERKGDLNRATEALISLRKSPSQEAFEKAHSHTSQDGKIPKAHRPLMLQPGAEAYTGAWPASHQVVEHRVTVLDANGTPHYNSTTQTRIGHPVPAGVSH